jgi:hypothetical protein
VYSLPQGGDQSCQPLSLSIRANRLTDLLAAWLIRYGRPGHIRTLLDQKINEFSQSSLLLYLINQRLGPGFQGVTGLNTQPKFAPAIALQ